MERVPEGVGQGPVGLHDPTGVVLAGDGRIVTGAHGDLRHGEAQLLGVRVHEPAEALELERGTGAGELRGISATLEMMDRPDGTTGPYLRESPYTFEGEVEFLQESARYATRRGWGRYLRWSIYLAAAAVGAGLVVAGLGTVL